MKEISQKQINKIIEILEGENRTEETIDLANSLKAVDIIGSLYVTTYLKVIDSLRKKTQVPDESSDFNKKYKVKRDDFENFKEELDRNYQLELSHLIETPEEFKGAMWLLYQALDRENLICDFDDGVHSPTIIGKCQEDNHLDNYDSNNEDQTLHLTYAYSEDNHKMDKREPIYICKKCQDNINENSDGYVSCDTEMAE